MVKLAKLLPILMLLGLTLFVDIFVSRYLTDLGLTPKDSHIVTIISTISYVLGAISMAIYYRYQ